MNGLRFTIVRIAFVVLAMTLVSMSAQAQQTSRGRDFYFSFLPNIHNNGGGSDDSLYVYVIADSATTGTLTYKNRNGTTFTQNIVINNPNQIWSHRVQWAQFELLGYNQSQNFSTNNDLETAAPQVFHVQTDRNVAVYALNKAATTSDASLVLPTDLLGTDYYVLAYKSDGVVSGGGLDLQYTPSEFVVVATDSNTTVTVYPSVPTTETGNATKTFNLAKGQAYLFQSQYSTTSLRYDLSGSHVTSNKPVAVFAGHQRATIPVELRGTLISRDHLYEELLPTAVWGRSYVITPLAQPQGSSVPGNDIWRVVAQDDGTTLNFNNVQVAVLNRGQVYEAPLTAAGLLVASKKVMVALYKKTHSNNNMILQPGDPFMMIIPPRRQYLTKYRYTNIQANDSFIQQFITLVTTRSNVPQISYDGGSLNATFIDIPNTCFAYSNIAVTSAAHTIQSPQPVGLYVYGYGDADSYGYVGGLALQPDVADVDIDAGPDRTMCFGDTVQLHVTGAGSQIKWKPSSGLNCDTCANVIAQPTQTTTYIVSAVDSLGCPGTDTIVVNVRKFLIDAGRDTSMCAAGDSVTITAKGLNGSLKNVTWTPKTGLACDTCLSTKAHPVVTTNYIAVGVDSIGCKGRDTVKITIRAGLQVDAGPDQEFCSAADSVVLKATLANGIVKSVKWTPSTGLGCDTCLVTRARPSGNMTYFVTIRDSAGCEGMDSVHILLKSRAGNIHASGAQFICFKNDSAQLAINGKAMTVKWSPSTGVVCDSCLSTWAKPLVTTTYKCTGLDAQGCLYEDSVKVTILPKATVEAQPDTVACTSTGIALRAEGSFTSVTWSPPIGLSCTNCPAPVAIPPQKDMTYYVRVRNGNSADCEAIDSVKVKYARGIEGQLPASVNLCTPDSIVFTIKFGGKVQWKPSLYLSCDTCKTVVIKPNSNVRYTVEGDSMGCTSKVIMDLKVSQRATFVAPADTAICRGDSVLINTKSNSTTNAILWVPFAGLDCPTCLRPKAGPLVTTTYIGTSGTGNCATRDTITITVKDKPVAALTPSDTSLCGGGFVQYQLNLQTTGSSIQWSPTTGLSCTDCPNPIARPTQNIDYTVHLSGPNGCDSTLTAHIGIGKEPQFKLSNSDTTFCRGGSVDIHVTGDTSGAFVWQPSIGVQCPTCATTRITPDSSRTYVVRGRDVSSGCEHLDTLIVNVNQLPPIDSITPPTRICQKQSARLWVSAATSYLWTPSTGLDRNDIQSPTATPTSTTTYTVRLINAAGCSRDSSVTITVAPCGDSLVMTPSGGNTPFIACDSTDASFTITNYGQIPITLDSVSIFRLVNAGVDVALLAQENLARFPLTLNPGETMQPGFRVRLFPNSVGTFTVVFKVNTSNSSRIDSVRFVGNGYRRAVEFKLGSTSVTVDSSFAYPIFGQSNSWAELKIRDVSATIRFPATSMQFDTSKVIERGDMVDATWTVTYDAIASSLGIAVFRANGTTPLSTNGVLMRPYFKTLLGADLKFTPTLEYTLPGLRLPCADIQALGGSIDIITCAADLRRVTIGATEFQLISITPNPSGSGLTTVRYSIGFSSPADLRMYDELGREALTLAYGLHSEGIYEVDLQSTSLAAGTYTCTLSTAGHLFTKRLVITR